MSAENPRDLVQANVRITRAMAEEFRKLAAIDGFHWQKVVRDAMALYLTMRKAMPPRVWQLLHGAALGSGKEPGELMGELAEGAYAERYEELFAPKKHVRPVKP